MLYVIFFIIRFLKNKNIWLDKIFEKQK